MKKNRTYLLLLSGIILINTGTVLSSDLIPDFVNGMLKGIGIVSFAAFIYYSVKLKNPGSEQVHKK